MVPRTVCPAAIPVAGVVTAKAGVICAVMRDDRAREQGFEMNPAQLEVARGDGAGGSGGGVFLTVKSDPSTIERMCCADGVPVVNEFDKPGGRDTYTYCPVWQTEKDRIQTGREMLSDYEPPESVGVGADGRELFADDIARRNAAEGDPWARARRDLDELAS